MWTICWCDGGAQKQGTGAIATVTQTIDFETECPEVAGFWETPQQAFLHPRKGAKIAGVSTPALLAVSAYPRKAIKKAECAFYAFDLYLASFNASIMASTTLRSFSSKELSIASMCFLRSFSPFLDG